MSKEKLLSKAERMAKFMSGMNQKYKKTYGEDVVYSSIGVGNFSPLATGFPNFDWINSGIGGFPRGGMTLIHGPESTGKTTLCLDALSFAMNRDQNLRGLFIDVENALTDDFLNFKKIDKERMDITPLNNEDGLIIAENAIKEGDMIDFIVIDSLAKLESNIILKKEMGEAAQRGRRAVMITDFLRRISLILRKSNCALICINQVIENQNAKGPWDPKFVLPGGRQQLFSANLRIELKRGITLKDGDKPIGYRAKLISAKNKIASREKAVTELTYLYDRGFVREIALLDYLIEIGYVVELPRKTYEFKDKNWYEGTFKVGEILKIQRQIASNLNVDLFDIKPSDNFKFKVDENFKDIKSDEGGELPDGSSGSEDLPDLPEEGEEGEESEGGEE